MADRRPKLLTDALWAIRAAREFMAGRSWDEYIANLMLRSAVERQFEILGEACSRLAREHPDLFVEIPATRLAVGMRNRIIHGYAMVDDQTLYATVVDHLPALQDALQALLLRIDPGA
jgi:uncharacterized protein with HEPN domain